MFTSQIHRSSRCSIIFLSLLLLSLTSNAQNGIQNLYFNSISNILKLNFATNNPSVTYTNIGSGASIGEGIAHVEDKQGNVIVWVNASGVYDKYGILMPSSTGILAHPSSTEIVICPFSTDPDKYYVIYNNETCSQLYYSVVDMKLRGGLGDVIELNTPIDASNTFAEGLEIVRIPCTNQYWLLAYQCYTGFKRFKIDANGITGGTILRPFNTDNHHGRGELDYHNGKMGYAVHSKKQAFFASFDPVNGILSNAIVRNFVTTDGMYGLEFSPDASKVYVTDWFNRDFLGNVTTANLFRYDFSTGTATSWTIPYNTSNCKATRVDGLGQIELGKDGKLYIPHVNGCQITVIENPNELLPAFSVIDVNTVLSTGVSDHIQSSFLQPLQISSDQTICPGEQVQISVKGGSNHRWQPIDGLSDPFSMNPTAKPTVTTTYKVFVNNEFGCQDSAAVTVFVNEPAVPIIQVPEGDVICGIDTIVLKAPVGYSAYTWFKEGVMISSQSLDSLWVYDPGNYTVQVTNSRNCSAVSTPVNIKQSSIPNVPLSLSGSPQFCEGESLLISTIADKDYSYQWFKNNQKIEGQHTSQLQVIAAGVYQVKITNADNCSALSASQVVKVNKYPVVNLGKDTTLCQGTTMVLQIDQTSTDFTYVWSDNSTASSLEVTKSGTYTLTVYNGSCAVTDSIHVTFLDDELVNIPNVITPNGDMQNEFFTIENGFGKMRLMIYNRWGKEVFYSEDYKNEWNASGLSTGLYFYTVSSSSTQCFKGRKGWIQVLR